MKSDKTLAKAAISVLAIVLLAAGCAPLSFGSSTATSTPVPAATAVAAPDIGSASAVLPTNTPLPTSTTASATAAPVLSTTTSVATATPSSLSEQPDAAAFATYFSAITLGRVPRGTRPVNTSPTPTTSFSSGDFICVTYDVVKTMQPGLGLYDVERQKWVLSKTTLPQSMEPGSYTRCEPFVPAVGRYEAMVWVGDTLVYVQPFEVR